MTNRETKDTKRYKKICPICKNPFETNYPRQKYCFPECSKESYQLKAQLPILRWVVFNRDDFTCQYCGKGAEQGVELILEHIVSRPAGGETDLDNLVTSCATCNHAKGDKPLKDEAGFKKRVRKRNKWIPGEITIKLVKKCERCGSVLPLREPKPKKESRPKKIYLNRSKDSYISSDPEKRARSLSNLIKGRESKKVNLRGQGAFKFSL